MINSNKQKLQDHLTKFGKDLSWEELGKLYNMSGEAARHIYRRLKNNPKVFIPDTITKLSSDETITQNYITTLEDTVASFVEDLKNGTAQTTVNTTEEIKCLDDLIRVCKIDTVNWTIDKYIQNFWGDKYQVKAFLSKKTKEQNFQQEFLSFIESYEPKRVSKSFNPLVQSFNKKGCLILNKQDIHWNKFSEDGNNNILIRFDNVYKAIEKTLSKTQISFNLDTIFYIVGSDEFDSEWTGATVKGTPQKSILNYQEGFELICNHEIEVIDLLRSTGAKVEVIYIPGNHDEYVGWHLIHFLESQYKQELNISFDISTDYTKYRRWDNTAIQFNHGDAITPAKLANMFPIEFKTEWSKCDHYISLIGDKHHSHYKDFNGIQFYQLPAMSSAKSKWDKKNGYTVTKAEMKSFVIEEENGITDIYSCKLD